MSARSSLLVPWPVRVGPYAFAAVLDPPARFKRPHWRSEVDYNREIIRVRHGLSPWMTARYFWLRVVRAMHYTAGLDDGYPEESFTHSYATGLIAFVRANPRVWEWFNGFLDRHMTPEADYARHATGKVDLRRLTAPQRLRVGMHDYRVESMPLTLSTRLNCWGDCNLETRVMRLSDELYGAHLAVIFWHELTHAMHREDGLDDGHGRAHYANSQTDRTLRFIVDNPHAWRWFLALTAQMDVEGRTSQQRLRLAA